MSGSAQPAPREEHGRAAVLAALPDDTGRRLDIYAALLARWQPTINLVSPATLPELWTRHIGDSLQVAAALPWARSWVDLGSGGGFPGLVTAIVLAGQGDLAGQGAPSVQLVESDKRKAAFLRAVVRETGAPAVIHAARIEDVVPELAPVEAVSARALAALPRLLELAGPLLEAGAIGVFPRGETVAAELTAPGMAPRFAIESVPSRFRHGSSLLIVRATARPAGRG